MAAGALQILIEIYFPANSSTSLEAGDNQKPKSINAFLSRKIKSPAENPKNNALKKMNLLIDSKKKNEALKFLPKLNSELMKIAKTGIIKKQNASRNVSRITKKIAAI